VRPRHRDPSPAHRVLTLERVVILERLDDPLTSTAWIRLGHAVTALRRAVAANDAA
jgi:hypothetical protein